MNKTQLALLASSQTNDLFLDCKIIGIVLIHGNGTSKRQNSTQHRSLIYTLSSDGPFSWW